jgi:hypothetical protein
MHGFCLCRSRLAGDPDTAVMQTDRVIVDRQQAGSYKDWC